MSLALPPRADDLPLRDRITWATSTWRWELLMGVLAIAYVAVGLVVEQGGDGLTPSLIVEVLLTLFFFVEFGVRLAASRRRADHLIEHWVDLVALIPAVRGLRFLRLLRLLRSAISVQRATESVRRLDRYGALVELVIAWLFVMLIGGLTFYFAEIEVNPSVGDGWDAAWWAVTTITGGQNEMLPTTEDGRLAAVILLVGGTALFAAITASVFRIFGAEPVEPFTPEGNLRRRFDMLLERRMAGQIGPEEFRAEASSLAKDAAELPVQAG